MTTTLFGNRERELESGLHTIDVRAATSLLVAYNRYPGRWSEQTFLAAMRVPDVFDGLTPSDAEEALDAIARVIAGAQRPMVPRR